MATMQQPEISFSLVRFWIQHMEEHAAVSPTNAQMCPLTNLCLLQEFSKIL